MWVEDEMVREWVQDRFMCELDGKDGVLNSNEGRIKIPKCSSTSLVLGSRQKSLFLTLVRRRC